MSTNWVADIHEMHNHYGFHEWVNSVIAEGDTEKLRKFIEFRLSFLDEELDETKEAVENGDPAEVVDGLIDLCVIAIGTMDIFGIDGEEAWNRVHAANMNKRVGVKESRPNPLGMPDLIKDEDWVAPEHDDNVGHLTNAL